MFYGNETYFTTPNGPQATLLNSPCHPKQRGIGWLHMRVGPRSVGRSAFAETGLRVEERAGAGTRRTELFYRARIMHASKRLVRPPLAL